jgi:hypothetical protein
MDDSQEKRTRDQKWVETIYQILFKRGMRDATPRFCRSYSYSFLDGRTWELFQILDTEAWDDLPNANISKLSALIVHRNRDQLWSCYLRHYSQKHTFFANSTCTLENVQLSDGSYSSFVRRVGRTYRPRDAHTTRSLLQAGPDGEIKWCFPGVSEWECKTWRLRDSRDFPPPPPIPQHPKEVQRCP